MGGTRQYLKMVKEFKHIFNLKLLQRDLRHDFNLTLKYSRLDLNLRK